MSDLDDIRDILGIQPYRGAPTDWEAASQALGVSIPGDFRALVNALGPGLIGNDTILLQPYATDENYDQVLIHQERMRGLETIWEEETHDPPELRNKPTIFDEPGVRPVLWAYSGLGFYLHWVARPDTDPASWQIAFESARGEDWEFHPGTATSFLLRLLRGQEPSKYLDYLQHPEQHSFTPAR
ncbi:hypothetical protein OHB12_02555 [Nocardia sp. NBC_01730]|uniref:hypothetical protein n=1 Tax=Nocardia sp. NBC_01730 TaxID=2975998 RepID=UPI002E0EA15B|nr:hypothetical protein OHB12_02555 [Nocardia sp. NBC_01730]